MRYKVAIRFAVQDDVRFISHHDMMRLFERALARTQLPVRFSEGFNPRPKLSLPLPRPVGIASTADVLVVEFTGPMDPQEALRQLAAQMPGSVTLEEAWIPPGQRPMQPESATYSLELPADQVAPVGERIGVLLQASNWPIRRSDSESEPGKELDLRSYLLHAGIEGRRLSWTVRISGGGTIRPSEFLAAVGLDPAQWHHRVCRTAIAWRTQAPAGPEPHSPADE
ncbi:MAG TPA: TIGR03936 family radical SAM-associated protein [Phycisphaerae bacterium]|mgnify:CR=1 FL=1|nr:TIGR03936 family radical SAM-associated protein [Phycisphaerae bacterium]HOJ74478.1 TIGR03936 family radical SAM-associated protein [Phycisphaerae bacterium]HOM53325.1 TIGR03936 family radical SAM-associated protein [Phycisphaerae bacterium]HON67727.1 TIGR03936 family radical SAM-associated protein [Phycisphaerae bacterium]HOQ87110.1 TIGR03936 family radical SAM-associated protein [Phycisphaerae bacterium]